MIISVNNIPCLVIDIFEVKNGDGSLCFLFNFIFKNKEMGLTIINPLKVFGKINADSIWLNQNCGWFQDYKKRISTFDFCKKYRPKRIKK